VVSGHQWLRELTHDGAASGVEVDGLPLSPATVAALATLDLTRLVSAPAHALVAGHDPACAAAAERLASLGCAVTDSDFPSYEALFSRVTTWMERSFPTRVPQEVISLHLAAERVALHPRGATELPVRFGPGLNGVLALPEGAASDGRAVIFCNTGGEPRAGVGRCAVIAARALAHRGVASLRFDFAGLGDSDGESSGHIYQTSRLDDFDAALTLMTAEGFPEISLVGVGPGGFHAVRALIADPRVGGAMAVNAKLVWRGGEDPASETDPAAPADLQTMLKALSRRLAARLSAGFDDAEARTLREGLAQVAERGGRAHLLMGSSDRSLGELETCFGGKTARLAAMPGMSFRVDPGLDQDLARRDSREIALRELLAFVGAD
jgi:hypothetical protein